VLAAIAGVVLMSSTPDGLPRGAVPVRCELELASAEGEAVAVKAIAVVRVANQAPASANAYALYHGRTLDDVAAAATALIESLARAELGGRPRAELTKPTIRDLTTPPGWFKDAFVRLALEVDALWIGPA